MVDIGFCLANIRQNPSSGKLNQVANLKTSAYSQVAGAQKKSGEKCVCCSHFPPAVVG